MKANPILTNFTAGEFSPRLNGRVDISKYYNACRSLKNMIVFPHGGASRRFGTVYVAECKDSSKEARLIPFQFSTTQAYIIEAGENYFRFYMNNGTIVSGASPYEIATPYTEAQLSGIKWTQNADTMRLVNQAVAPQTLIRTGHTAWTLATTTFTAQPAQWTAGNWPGVVALYEQRSVYAATPNEPQTIWFSVTAVQDDMTTGTNDDDGMELTLDSDQVNTILWMVPARYLNIGTVDGEWMLSGASATNDAITPTSRKARRISNYGSANIQAKFINNAVIFVQRVAKKVRELIYNYINDDYGDPSDLTLLAEHITSTGIKSFAFQKVPEPIGWYVLNDGNLISVTYNKTQEIVAWCEHNTVGYFEDVAVIPTDTHDQVWFIVKREVDGSEKRYIEYMATDFGDDQNACWFVDSGLAYSGTESTSVTGLDHLEGCEVSILADGAALPNDTVVSGAISIPDAAASITVGLPYTSVLEPMDLEIQGAGGSTQGARKKIHQAIVRFYKTLGAQIGTKAGTEEVIPFRTPSDLMGSPPPLFTGDKVTNFSGGWDRHGYIRIIQDQPLPMTILAIVPKVSTND